MGRSVPFEPVLSSKALAFLLALGKRRQKQLANLLFKLADYPYQLGDCESVDDTGRRIQPRAMRANIQRRTSNIQHPIGKRNERSTALILAQV
jgi:hypothetical protein